MINKFTHLHNFISDITPFNISDGLNLGTLCFDYDFTNWPNYFGIVTSYVHKGVSGVEIEIIKVQTNYKIEIKIPITSAELYPYIEMAVMHMTQPLAEKYEKIGIILETTPCPSLNDMRTELDNLANDLNLLEKKN